MQTYSEIIGNKLNDLLIRTHDAEKGFKNAAENVNHTGLKSFFNKKAEERQLFTSQLKAAVGGVGQKATESEGSTLGTVHRTWMDLKNTVSSNNSEAMLEEAIRGEKKAVEEYNEVINETSLPSQTKKILEGQLSMINDSLSKVKSLEDIY